MYIMGAFQSSLKLIKLLYSSKYLCYILIKYEKGMMKC